MAAEPVRQPKSPRATPEEVEDVLEDLKAYALRKSGEFSAYELAKDYFEDKYHIVHFKYTHKKWNQINKYAKKALELLKAEGRVLYIRKVEGNAPMPTMLFRVVEKKLKEQEKAEEKP